MKLIQLDCNQLLFGMNMMVAQLWQFFGNFGNLAQCDWHLKSMGYEWVYFMLNSLIKQYNSQAIDVRISFDFFFLLNIICKCFVHFGTEPEAFISRPMKSFSLMGRKNNTERTLENLPEIDLTEVDL